MITALDTNVLLDVLIPGAPHAAESEASLAAAEAKGSLIVSELVYAELSVRFPSQPNLDNFIEEAGIRLQPSGRRALHRAGQAWTSYLRRRPDSLNCAQCGAQHDPRCERCGSPLRARQHVLADFLIGAHAEAHADQLLTRDRGYYATYFPNLRLL